MIETGEEVADVRVEHPVTLLREIPVASGIQRINVGCALAGTRRRTEEVHLFR